MAPRKPSNGSQKKAVHAGEKRRNLVDKPASKRARGNSSSGTPKDNQPRSVSSAQTEAQSNTRTGDADHSARHSNNEVITDDDADRPGNPGVASDEADESDENSDEELGKLHSVS